MYVMYFIFEKKYAHFNVFFPLNNVFNVFKCILFYVRQPRHSVLWRCWLGSRKGIRPVKNWVLGCWCGCLGWGADLYIAQQMPLPLTVSCSSKYRLVLIFLVLPFWYLLTRVVPDKFQKSSKTVVCVWTLAKLRTVFTRDSIYAIARICSGNSVCLSVRLSVCLSVCHTGGSVKNGWS